MHPYEGGWKGGGAPNNPPDNQVHFTTVFDQITISQSKIQNVVN